MSDQSIRPTGHDSEAPAARGPGMPGWVKVFLVVAVLLALALAVSFVAGVQHGPGLHDPGGSGDDVSMGVARW